MPHGVEPRSKDKEGPIPTDLDQLHAWWSRQPEWSDALDLCVKRKRADAMIQAGRYTDQWRGGPWTPSRDAIRWIHGYLCRTPGMEAIQSMGMLAPSLVMVGGVNADGMLRGSLLVEAARSDRADLIEWMLKLPLNCDQEPTLWPHIAHIAASNGSLHCLDMAIARRPDIVVHANPKGRTPLHVAAGYGHEAAIEKLLKAGADARLRDELGRTPLAALMTGHREVSGWPNNTARGGWQGAAMLLIREGEGPEQHYGKTARSGTLADRVKREVSADVANELVNLGKVYRSQLALEAYTEAPSSAGSAPPMPRL